MPEPELPPEMMPGVPELFAPEIKIAAPASKPRFGVENVNASFADSELSMGQYSRKKLEYPEYDFYSPENNPLRIFPDGFALPNRWDISFGKRKRYADPAAETPYMYRTPAIWDPYRQSLLKGDTPIIGQDIFLNLTAVSFSEFEFRSVPTPSGISTARPDSTEFFGNSEQFFYNQNLAFSFELFKGETAFKPVEWLVKITPVFNINYTSVKETTVLDPDPRGPSYPDQRPLLVPPAIVNPSDVNRDIFDEAPQKVGSRYTTRTRTFLALQEAFLEIHLADLTDNYDFLSSRFGNQFFVSDFRGFIFNDTNLGFRFFGNYENNLWQYNLAFFSMREKDTYSELNTFDERDQNILVANVFRQDLIWKGYTGQLSFHLNNDQGGVHYNRDEVLTRPQPVGTIQEHDVNAIYLGWTGEGHIGRWNISHSFYQAFGRDEFNGIAGRPVDINAQMFALEVSYDRDWIRPKAYFFYASGDDDPGDETGTGFDSIIDNPAFAGAPFSYFARQGFGLGNTSTLLKTRNSLLNNLRTSKFEGQANFVNPGTLLFGFGLDVEITPKLRAQANANYIRFANTETLETALFQNKIDEEIGWDFSVGLFYRPTLTDNIIISAGVGFLVPGSGFKDIYRQNTRSIPGTQFTSGDTDDFYYSGLITVTLTY